MIAGSQTDRERGNAPDREQDNEQQLHPFARVELLLFTYFVGLPSGSLLEAQPARRSGRPGGGAARTCPPWEVRRRKAWERACLTGS